MEERNELDLFAIEEASEELINKNTSYVEAENKMSPEAQAEYDAWLKENGGVTNE